MFVTIQCLVFDLERGCVTGAGAGHHQLALLSPNRAPRLAFPSSGRPAGLFPSNAIECETLTLEPGDTFVLFSDGVSEATNITGDFYGEDRLLTRAVVVRRRIVRRHCHAGDGRRPRIRCGAKQSDDITVLAARYAPAS